MIASDQLVVTSRLFSSAVFQELARRGRSPLFSVIAKKLGYSARDTSVRVRDVFETGFERLRHEGHRDEYVYKSALVRKILLGRHNLKTATLLNEFRVGECKADIAILNGTSTVYEIKSERDTLARLERQLDAYSRVFAKVNVVAAETHVAAIRSAIPAHVGIMVIGRRFNFAIDREAEDRTARLSVEAIFESLRTEEARRVLESLGHSIPALPNMEISRALRALFVRISPEQAHEKMIAILKITRNQYRLQSLLESLPVSLHAATLCTTLRKLDHPRLLSAIDVSLDQALAWG